MALCRILLTPLTGRDEAAGYSARGLKRLTGSGRASPQLPFTRSEFISELPKVQAGMSISGYQPKLQMVPEKGIFSVVEHQGEYILKPSPAEFPFLAENEHATMNLMARLGFDVPPHGLVRFAKAQPDEPEEYAFVIRRYDRDQQGNALHQEQLDAAMDIGEKYGKTAADGKQYVSYEQLATFLLANVNDNLAFKIDLFRRIAYAYLLGNNDMHLRNFGLILPPLGKPELAPIYDFVSVAPYSPVFNSGFLALPLLRCEEGDGELAPGMKTQYGEYLGKDFLVLGEAMGLAKPVVLRLFAQMLSEAKTVEAVYRASFMPAGDSERVLQCYQQRLKRMMNVDEVEMVDT
ncbi:type II toxin-antitoxin system HipA family toxin [Siccibacter turicensis]|uniref:type II toxin-antitoxin system HipA family toxin n=1 Tax=Siccibacter turicensis TaxID=357233 RepID=UPI003F560600